MHLIALTGGIASGKSTVAKRWAEHGAVVVDADALAREVVEPDSPALAAIVDRFGADVLHDDGSLNRQALGSIVFGDSDARQALNSITHPAISRLAKQRFAAAFDRDPEALIVYDIPLLVESGQPVDKFSAVVTVEADPETRIQRLIEHRNMPRGEAEGRVASQASSADRRAVADFVVDSGAELADTERHADNVWQLLRDQLVSSR
ncbi:dephospho-CoA kinase [Salinibacterium sp. NK8237]|uniref:dephospho-CoA kinase n=1 Tax=Salinibacterium sp. NK8237 TaxID=2792038 RepID=UPI0018CF4ECA|nr:dephospho-CoA kinase [Salinibacterium sp. NK8237]MBH0129034.1 dephospho-CoA kinase [Salinibacterium sp. NK8237]